MLFKGEFPVLGLTTQLQELSGYTGAGAGYTIQTQAFKPSTREVIDFPIPASAALSQYIYQAPFTTAVIGLRLNWVVQSTGASNLSVLRVVGDTVAPGAANGTTLILLQSAVTSMQGTANTRQNLALSTASGLPLVLSPGDQIAVFASATLAGLSGANLQIELAQIG